MPVSIWVFIFQFVDEIKNADTNKAFEKLRLVVQAYNNFNKDFLLIQLPTIKQVSKYLIVCLAAIFQNNITKLCLYNVTQIYIQLTLDLNRKLFICLLLEIITIMEALPKCILKVVKLLHSVLEVRNH